MTWGQIHFQQIIPKTIPLGTISHTNRKSSEISAVILNQTVLTQLSIGILNDVKNEKQPFLFQIIMDTNHKQGYH